MCAIFRFAAAAEQHGLRPACAVAPSSHPAQSGDLPPLVAQVLARIERGELAEHSLGPCNAGRDHGSAP